MRHLAQVPRFVRHLAQHARLETSHRGACMSILDQWQDRWNFAVYDKEQRFQTQLVTKRRLFTNIVGLPLSRWQNNILTKDYVDTAGEAVAPRKGLQFDAAAFSFVDDVFISAGGGQVVRSFLLAYGNQKEFRDINNTARALGGLGITAEALDDSPTKLGEEISAGHKGIMYDLVHNSGKASSLLEDFVHGKLEVTPTNIAKLEKHLHALAAICDEKAAMKEGLNAMRGPNKQDEKENSKPMDYIRDVIHADTLTSPREVQILSGFVSALIVEAAKPLGTESFIPEKEIFMKPEEAIALSSFVATQLEHHGFVPNVALSADKPLPVADVPEGAMVQAERNEKGEIISYSKIPAAKLLVFGNAIHTHLKKENGVHIEAVMGYVDKHFDSVEQVISRSQEDALSDNQPIWLTETERQRNQSEAAANKYAAPWETGKQRGPRALMKEVGRAATSAVAHIWRPEARHEANKLFARNLANGILGYPINIFDNVLKDFLRPGKGYDILKNDLLGRHDPDRENTELLDGDLFKRNVFSRTHRLLTQPFAASYGTVYLQELYNLPSGLAIDAAKRSGGILNGAIRAGHRHAPQVADRLSAMGQNHPSLDVLLRDARYKEEIPRITALPDEERTAEDYVLLGQYYRDMSNLSVSMAEEVFAPYGIEVTPEKIDSIEDVVERVLRRPVQNVPDAMIALAFVETFVELSKKNIGAMEFVDPRKLLIGGKELHKFGDFVAAQAAAAGFVVATGKEGEGIAEGELLVRDPKTGALAPLDAETLVRFANVMTSELKQHVSLDALLFATKGKFKDDYMSAVEKHLFKDAHFNAGMAQEDAPSVRQQAVQEDLMEPWSGKVKRKHGGLRERIRETLEQPEVQHETRKLYNRSRGETITASISGLFHNSLLYNEGVLSRSSALAAIYKTLTFPIIYSKGLVAVKESINEVILKKRRTINEAGVTTDLIGAAMDAAATLDPDMRQRLIDAHQVNAALIDVEHKPEFKDVPRVAAKPRHLRTEEDDQIMQRFCDELGGQVIDVSAKIFASLGAEGQQSESMEDTLERALSAPVNNLADAMLALGFIYKVTKESKKQVDMLRFLEPEEKILSRGALRQLSNFINDQAASAGFAIHGVSIKGKNGNEFAMLGQDETLQEGELLQWNKDKKEYERAAPEAVIRFTNVLMEKFREVAADKVQNPDDKLSLVARYQAETKNEVFSRLQ